MGDLRRRSLLQTVGNGYTRVDYIESTGTQFIDTGVKLFETGNSSTNIRIVMDINMYSSTGNMGTAINAMKEEETSAYGYVIRCHENDGVWWSKSTPDFTAGRFGNLDTFLHIDTTVSKEINHTMSTTLFAMYEYDGTVSRYSYMRLYRCQLYDNNVLVGDYIPIRIGTEGCLYDKVSGRVLHNLGTGDFVCGEDLTYIEYLESSGTQYIDTYFIATGGSICEYEGTFLQSTCVIVGGHDTSSDNDYNRNYMRIENGSKFDAHKCENTPSISRSDLINTKHLYYHNTIGTGNLAKIDGETAIGGGSTNILAPNTTIEVFRLRWDDSRYSSRLYWLKIYNSNSVLVRDYIPVRCGITGYLYDQLNDVLYGNAGSGNFVLGDDLDPLIFKVSTTDGSSREGITFFLSDGTNTYTYVTDENGEAKVQAPAGTYTVSSIYWTLSINSVTISGQKKVDFTATKIGDELVDLGLSVLWAGGNICKSGSEYYTGSPTDRGCYYSWGNIEGHNKGEGYIFNSTVYQSTPGFTLTGNISSTDATHDAALACLGTGYRMPTKDEFDELIANCDVTWVTSYNGVSVAGSVFKSKKAGYTDKEIFIPASGYYGGNNLNNEGLYGFCWSSTYYSKNNAFRLHFYSRDASTSNLYKYYGTSIRAVKSK